MELCETSIPPGVGIVSDSWRSSRVESSTWLVAGRPSRNSSEWLKCKVYREMNISTWGLALWQCFGRLLTLSLLLVIVERELRSCDPGQKEKCFRGEPQKVYAYHESHSDISLT